MKELSSRQKQYNETHQQIFSAAMNLFSNRSFENVTVKDICKEAGISVGAFYHHFQSKEYILNEGYRKFDEDLEEETRCKRFSNSEEAINFLIESQLQSMQDNGVFVSIQFFKNQLSINEKYILNTDRFFYITLNKYLKVWLRENNIVTDSIVVVDEILRAARGTIYDWCLHDGKYDLVKSGIKLTKMILHFYIS